MAAPYPALYVAVVLLVVSTILLGVTNGTVVLRNGFGVSTTSISVWQTCVAQASGEDRCFSVTSNSQCSELSSRMKAIGAFTLISGLSCLVTAAAFVAEGRGMTLPVNHLTKVLMGWCIFGDVVAIGVAIGTLVAKLCSDPLPMTERNGQFGPAFYTMFAALFTMVVGGGLYAFFKMRRDAEPEGEDDDDDRAVNFADL